MAMPTGIPVIETFLGFPSRNRKDVYKFLAPHLRDDESKGFSFPAQYMFKDVPAESRGRRRPGRRSSWTSWTASASRRDDRRRARRTRTPSGR